MKSPTVVPHVFEDLRRTLFQAKMCEEVWWLLEGTHAERTTILKGANRHLNFFQVLRPGMYISFIVQLGSLFDQNPKSISLRSIPELVAHPDFAELWAKGRRLYRYRSKSIAHRDAENGTIDYAQETGFACNEVRGILHKACELFDGYAQAKNLPPLPSSQFSAGADLLRMLRKLAI